MFLHLYITYCLIQQINGVSSQHALYFLSVTVSFDPTTYTVTEGEDVVANLKLVRSGDLTRTVVVTVTATTGTAMGMNTILVVSLSFFLNGKHVILTVPLLSMSIYL